MAMDLNVALKINAGVTGQQAVDQLRTSMQRLEDGADGVSSRFSALKGAIAGLAASAAVGGFVALIKGAIDTGDKLNDLSQRTGIAVEDLDALGYVAQQNGSSLEAVSGALGKLAKNMAEAAGGSKEAVATFKQFGISQAELKSGTITTTEALARIAERIEAMPDGWQKTAAAQQVFGKSAAELVPLLNAGSDAIRNARAELEGYGALFSGSFAKAADEFNDRMALLKRTTGALTLSLATDLMPVMTGFVNGLISAKSSADDIGGNTSLQDWAANSALAVAALVDVIRVSTQSMFALIGSFQAVYADMKLAGTTLFGGTGFNPWSAENKKIFADALAERNAIVSDANQRYIDAWKMDGAKFFNAVKDATEKARAAAKEPVTLKAKKPTANFDFSAGKETKAQESEYEKQKKQLVELLAKTGDLTKAQETLYLLKTDRFKELTQQQRAELIGIAAQIDARKQQADEEKELTVAEQARVKAMSDRIAKENDQVLKFRLDQEDKISLLQMEAQKTSLTTFEYERRVEALKHEQEVIKATRDMLPEMAARYRELADATFAQEQAARLAAYEQSRTFGAGAQRAFSSYVEQIKDVSKSTEQAFQNAFQGMENAMVDFVMTGKLNFRSLAQSILADMARIAIQQAVIKPLLGSLGGLFGGGGGLNSVGATGGYNSLAPYAKGGAFGASGEITAFAYGGVVNRPTTFPFANGIGLMGEAGPEAIMPLRRGSDGRLGVTAAGGGDTNNIVVNVNVEGGDQASTQNGASALGKAVATAVRVELMNQKRPGGLLAA